MKAFSLLKNNFGLITLIVIIQAITFCSAKTDAELKGEIEKKIGSFVTDASEKSFLVYECPDKAKIPTLKKSCICISDLKADGNEFTITFQTPFESSKLVANNVDIDSPEEDEDFSIKHYVLNYINNAKKVLGDEDLKKAIVEKSKAIATDLGLTVDDEKLANGELLLIQGENKHRKGNNVISMQIDMTKLSVVFKTNFFENTFSMSMRHANFVESEIERALKAMDKDLKRMRQLLGHDKTEKSTMNQINCESILIAPYIGELKDRIGKFGGTVTDQPGVINIDINGGKATISCVDTTIDGKIGVSKMAMVSTPPTGSKIQKNQAFLHYSMYDLNAIVDSFLSDCVTLLSRFYLKVNIEEKVDFGKAALVQASGGNTKDDQELDQDGKSDEEQKNTDQQQDGSQEQEQEQDGNGNNSIGQNSGNNEEEDNQGRKRKLKSSYSFNPPVSKFVKTKK